MAKTKVRDWDDVATNNSEINGINIAEGCPAKNINNAIRETMKQVADLNKGNQTVSDTWSFGDTTDPTKAVRFDAGLVTAGQTRQLRMPDANIQPAHRTAPVPSEAGLGLADGDFNTIIEPGTYTIGGTWTNGPTGTATWTGVLQVLARSFSNHYVQIFTRSNGEVWMRWTATTNASTWPNAWMQLYTSTGTVADARLPTSMTGKTFTTAVTVGDSDFTDGEIALTIATDRPWTIRQRGESSTANLSFENTTNKAIGFSSDNVYSTPVIVLTPMTGSASITVEGNTVWHAGNDGASSGLDADLLDGQQGSYYRDLANSTGTLPNARVSGAYDGITNLGMTGTLTIQNTAPNIKFIDTTSGQYSARLRVDANNAYFDSSTDDVTFGEIFRFELDTKVGYVNGSRIVTQAAGTAYDSARLGGTLAATVQADIDSKAPLASPGLTGNPTAPTQTAGNNTTRLATTAFVTTAIGNINFGIGSAGIASGGVGDVMLLRAMSGGPYSPGSTASGASLEYAAVDGTSNGSSPSGTWSCRGKCASGGTTGSTTTWKRTL